jgi:hypothetical protein
MEHLIHNHFTGFGYLGLMLSDAFTGAVMDGVPTRADTDKPFLRRFFHNPDTKSFSRHTRDFRNKVENSIIEGNTYLEYILNEDFEKANKYLEKHPLAMFGSFKQGDFGEIDRAINQLKKAKFQVQRLSDDYFPDMTKKQIAKEKGKQVIFFDTHIKLLAKTGDEALDGLYNTVKENMDDFKIKIDMPELQETE